MAKVDTDCILMDFSFNWSSLIRENPHKENCLSRFLRKLGLIRGDFAQKGIVYGLKFNNGDYLWVHSLGDFVLNPN